MVVTRGKLSSTSTMENFKSNYLVTLEDPEIIQRFHLIFEPMFKSLWILSHISYKIPLTLWHSLPACWKKESAEKDTKIKLLSSEVAKLKSAADDLEQQGRKDSVRIFGLPETGCGSADDKVLALCNKRMKLPDLKLDEIAVAHRVGAIQDEEENDEPPPPRALLVKFASRRSKERVMAARSKLRPKKPPRHQQQQEGQQPEAEEAATDDTDEEQEGPLPKVYITDDLIRLRAKLAYRARVARRQGGEIAETWVNNCKVFIKDNHSRIHQIRSHEKLDSHKTK